MKINELKEVLKDKRVIEEINKHLWIESQKAGYNIGFERAMDEWLRLYAEGWMKYNMPEKYMAHKAKQKTARKPGRTGKKDAGKKKIKSKTPAGKSKKK